LSVDADAVDIVVSFTRIFAIEAKPREISVQAIFREGAKVTLMSDSAVNGTASARSWRAFAVCAAVIALTILDLTKITVGLPAIERSLDATSADLQLIVSGYVLAFGLALVPAGRIGDVHSRKLMFVTGLVLFALASLVCALAPSIEMLIFGRIIQGVAAGIQMPQALGLVQQLFTGSARDRAYAQVGSIIAISTAVGPALGGLLITLGDEDDGWRMLFWVNLPIALTALVFAILVIPNRQRHERQKVSLDLVGLALFGVAVLALMLPFVSLPGLSEGALRWLWIAVSALATVTLVRWERDYQARGKSPVFSSELMRLPGFRNGLLIMATFFSSVGAVFLIVALFLQVSLGVPPLEAGLVSIPQAVLSAITSWWGGRLVERMGRKLVVVGLLIVSVGLVLVIVAAVYSPPEIAAVTISSALAVIGAGTGFVLSPNQSITLRDVPVDQSGVGASLTQVAQRVATAIGLALTTAVYFAVLGPGTGHSLDTSRTAVAVSVWLCVGLLALALAVGVADLRRTKRLGR
jgi:MFS family permease